MLGIYDMVDKLFEGVEMVADSPSGSLVKVQEEYFLVKTEERESGVRNDRVRQTCQVGVSVCHYKQGTKNRS